MIEPSAPRTQALVVARRYAGPAIGGIAAAAFTYHGGGTAAIGHLVDQIGFAEALVVTTVAAGGTLVWATGKTIAGWVEATAARAMPRVDSFLGDFKEAATASMATASFLREADENARAERARHGVRIDELAQMSERDNADLADGMRRCESHAREAAQAAEAARVEVLRLSERFGAHMERAITIADRAATDAARAANLCEALARELQVESIIPAAVAPPLPIIKEPS